MNHRISCYFSSSLVVTLCCKYLLLDGGGVRNLAIRRENGVNHIAERIHTPSTLPDLQKKTNTAPQATRL